MKSVEPVADPEEIGRIRAVPDARKLGPRLGAEVQLRYEGRDGADVAADHGMLVSLETALTP